MSDAMHIDYPQGATPAEIWAILREVAEGQKETRLQMQETDRLVQENAERQKETDRQMQENARQLKETKELVETTFQRMKQADKQLGELTNRFGELAEHLVAPNILEKFNAHGFTFNRVYQNPDIIDTKGNRIAEIDILLENGGTVMVVEVKAKPKQKDVEGHIQRMEVLRRDADERNDKRVYMGAIAGAIMPKELRHFIIKTGFYAIEQTGDTVMINIPEGFKPRKW